MGIGWPRVAFVGAGEVGKNAFQCDPRQVVGVRNQIEGALWLDAEATHAGVYFDVQAGICPYFFSHLGSCSNLSLIPNRKRNLLRDGLLQPVWGNVSQDQDGIFYAGLTEFQGFLNAGHAEPRCPTAPRRSCRLYRPVSIGIGFDNRHDFSTGLLGE